MFIGMMNDTGVVMKIPLVEPIYDDTWTERRVTNIFRFVCFIADLEPSVQSKDSVTFLGREIELRGFSHLEIENQEREEYSPDS